MAFSGRQMGLEFEPCLHCAHEPFLNVGVFGKVIKNIRISVTE
jgi:hypothetical protein